VVGLTGATPAPKTGGSDDATSECRQIPVVGTYYTDSAGRRSATPSAGSSTTRVYNAYGGHMSVTVPPKTWNPVIASDAEIQRYGLYPRPKSAAQRKLWEQMYAHVSSWVLPDMCATNFHAAAPKYPIDSHPIWSGAIAKRVKGAPAFTGSSYVFDEPKFDGGCKHASSYNLWSGLGGLKSGRLMQNGIDNAGKGLNDDYAWWEVLSDDKKNSLPEMEIKNFKVRAGDRIFAGISYYAPKKQVSFNFYNYRTKKAADLGPWGVIDTPKGSYLASAFYDGSTAEQIVERTTVGKKPVMLRKPHGGYSHTHEAGFANGRQDGEDFAFKNVWQYNMRANGTKLSEPVKFISKVKNVGTYLAQWNNKWDSCGS
jgi:hypothetical protein